MRRLLPALAWVITSAVAQPPEPEAVAARFPAPAVRYDTPAFQPGRTDFTRNDELHALLATLAQRPGVRRFEAGRSQRGVAIEALHVGSGGKPVALLVGQQHGDEPAGAEALLALARLLAAGALAPLLERVYVVLVPRANPDGAASGERLLADGTDLNRDHLLLRTPEARALAALVRRFDPLLVADLHEYGVRDDFAAKFGALPRADVLLQAAATPNLPPAVAERTESQFLRPLRRALDLQGLTHEAYHMNPAVPGDLRLVMGSPLPDTVRNVQGLALRPSVLLETRGLGLGRQHLQRRVHSHVVAALALLEAAAAQAADARAAREAVAHEVQAAACRGSAVVLAGMSTAPREVVMLDPSTGADRTVSVAWTSSQALKPVIVRDRPCGYLLAADAGPLVDTLRALGLAVRRVEQPQTLDVETYRETGRAETAQRGLQLLLALDRQRLEAPVGSWIVPLDQPLANLAIAALEPDAPGSFFAQRLASGLAGVARIVSAPARAPAQQ